MEWDESYREGETPWDLGEAAPPLAELLEERPEEIWGRGAVLVPGCGRGHDAAALHRAGRQVIGLDLSPRALADARKLYGSHDGLRWLEGDFFDSALAAKESIGAIFEHTCFCAILPTEREAYVQAAARWLAPGGCLVAVFFLDPPKREDGEDGPPFGSDRAEIAQLFGRDFTIEREGSPGRAHPDRAGREWVVEMIRSH